MSGSVLYLVDILLVCAVHVQCRHLAKRCDAPIDILGHRGCVRTELLEGSRVQFDALADEFTDGSKLEVQFKTTHTSGLVFYATRRHDDESLIAVHLHQGYLRYSFRCRYGSATLTYSKKRVNDNKWHSLIFRLEARTGIIFIDGRRIFRDYFVSCPGFTTIVFGGITPSHFGSSNVRLLQFSQQRAQLDGSMRRAKISTGFTAPPIYNLVSSCPRE